MAFAEYTILLGAFVLAVGLAILGLGVPLLQAYYLARLLILLPVP